MVGIPIGSPKIKRDCYLGAPRFESPEHRTPIPTSWWTTCVRMVCGTPPPGDRPKDPTHRAPCFDVPKIRCVLRWAPHHGLQLPCCPNKVWSSPSEGPNHWGWNPYLSPPLSVLGGEDHPRTWIRGDRINPPFISYLALFVKGTTRSFGDLLTTVAN